MDNQLAGMFHALGDPTRLAVISRLAEGPASVSALAEPFPMKLPPFTRHLRVLEDAGLVQSEKAGRIRTYRLDPAGLETVADWIHDRRALWRGRLDRLETFLRNEDPTDDAAP